MSKYEQEILQTVNLRGTVLVKELAQIVGVSEQTIRRITRPLQERGQVRKVHGALISTQENSEPPFIARINKNRSAKLRIARCVADIIKDGDTLAIDGGSTSGIIAEALRRRRSLTVVTNSAFVASTLSTIDGNQVFMAGTQLRNHDGAAFDKAAFVTIESFDVQYAILSVTGVLPDTGFLGFDQFEVDMARSMIGISKRTIIGVDKSKFEVKGNLPSLKLPTLRPDDIVVCDCVPAEPFASLFKDHLVTAT